VLIHNLYFVQYIYADLKPIPSISENDLRLIQLQYSPLDTLNNRSENPT